MHAANVLVNVGFGLVLGIGYDHWVAGAVNFAIGVVFGELTIFTMPLRLPTTLRLVPLLRPDGGGLALGGTF